MQKHVIINLNLSSIYGNLHAHTQENQQKKNLEMGSEFDATESLINPNTTTRTTDLGDATGENQEFDPIPQIDLQGLDLDKLREAGRDWGVFRLVNHGVPSTLLSQLHEHAKMLFSLPVESKQALFTSPLSYFRGTAALSPSGTAVPGGPQTVNRVEGFYFPLGKLSQVQAADHSLFDNFRFLLEEYSKHLFRIATTIFEAATKTLDRDPSEAMSCCPSEPTGFIRVYRYPQCSTGDHAWGVSPHTDSSVLAILSQDQVSGLEVYKDDEWILVKPVPDTLVVNFGDMIQAMSNDECKSVNHRVKVNESSDRHSLCYFVFPAEGSVIRSSKYRPFTYSDFQAQVQLDIKSTGYKVGLERFKLSQEGS